MYKIYGVDMYECEDCGYQEEGMFIEDYAEDPDAIPPGCAACGGPYPQCKTSCKIFDD